VPVVAAVPVSLGDVDCAKHGRESAAASATAQVERVESMAVSFRC
jgi:hypothetical protein